MKKISLINPSICSSNLGDQIIIERVNRVLTELFDEPFLFNIQSQDVIFYPSYRFIRDSNFTFVGGTNILCSTMNFRKQWKVNLLDSLFIKDIILMGVGWSRYQKSPNLYTKFLYKRLLNKNYLHSVRDRYTEQKLKEIGLDNVVNTSCPTMWSLTKEHCLQIPQKKSKSVLLTFTQHNQNQEFDSKLIEILHQEYETIYFWTQQPKDYQYMKNLNGDNAIYVKPNLKSLDKLLSESTTNIDYVGTRLHCGIRALQHKRRTLILSIDNRATEIAKDTNLPTVDRKNLDGIREWINSEYKTDINLPMTNINKWKNQFISKN